MPRTARASKGGYVYHVLNRGNARQAVFHKDGDYAAFLKLLREASERTPVRLLAYCLMPNHFHLAVWPVGRKYTSPALEFDVVAVPPEAVLSSFTVAVADKKYEMHPARPRIQQVRVAKKALLIYTGFAGVARLAELPGKVEMTVEGAYDPGNPLTVRYRDEKSKTGWTTLVINSIGGTPWTEEEERARIERAKSPVPESPPAPRPVKP